MNDGYAVLGKYPCCGEQVNPEFVCWETTMNDKKETLGPDFYPGHGDE